MSDLGTRIAHRRMMKVVKLEAREYYSSQQSFTASAAQATIAPTPSSAPVVSPLPVSTAAIAGVGGFLAVLVILVAGGCFWRRRKLRAKNRKSPAIEFNRDVFAAEKKGGYGMDAHVVADLSSVPMGSPTEAQQRSPRIQHTPTHSDSSHSSSTYAGAGWKPQALRVTNQTALADISAASSPGYLSKPPKALITKDQKHVKALWSPSPEDMARSPPPAYDFSNGAPGLYFSPPSAASAEQKVALPSPSATVVGTPGPTPPASNRKPSAKKLTIPNVLVVPEADTNTLPSPARSESFAPKDLVMPGMEGAEGSSSAAGPSFDSSSGSRVTQSPPTSSGSTQTFASTSTSSSTSSSSSNSSSISSSSSNSSSSSSSNKPKLPRMMTVAASYTPTLPDELRVTIGDTVRLLQEYKDGWGFVQYVGKIDSPKGVVPLVCLQERKRMIPSTIRHNPKTSTGSNASQSSLTGWR